LLLPNTLLAPDSWIDHPAGALAAQPEQPVSTTERRCAQSDVIENLRHLRHIFNKRWRQARLPPA
jgi:hypothetical protein